MNIKQAANQVRDLVDQLGRTMSPEDWIGFLEEVECDCEAKRVAAMEELEDAED